MGFFPGVVLPGSSPRFNMCLRMTAFPNSDSRNLPFATLFLLHFGYMYGITADVATDARTINAQHMFILDHSPLRFL